LRVSLHVFQGKRDFTPSGENEKGKPKHSYIQQQETLLFFSVVVGGEFFFLPSFFAWTLVDGVGTSQRRRGRGKMSFFFSLFFVV